MSEEILATGPTDPLVAEAPSSAVPDIELRGIRKVFGDAVAVDGIDLIVNQGEFFSLLGPSGSGKTTCLRIVAGFEEPTEGSVLLQGRDVRGLPPYDRDVNTVFQDYALFPHMNVYQNVEYGLRVKGVVKEERNERVADALRMVQLEGFERRRPAQLSGGQRQRVALARALVNRPQVLLLDEPLGALDLKLRQQMQIELKEIQQRVGLTFVYVTHDQEEALTMSDRLAVLNEGRIEQIGTPAEVYENPATAFVAGFVGISNILSGEQASQVTGDGRAFTIRPEKIRIAADGEKPQTGEVIAAGQVREVVYIGAITRYVVDLEVGGQLVVLQQNLTMSSMEALQVKGRAVSLIWNTQHHRYLDTPTSQDQVKKSPERRNG